MARIQQTGKPEAMMAADALFDGHPKIFEGLGSEDRARLEGEVRQTLVYCFLTQPECRSEGVGTRDREGSLQGSFNLWSAQGREDKPPLAATAMAYHGIKDPELMREPIRRAISDGVLRGHDSEMIQARKRLTDEKGSDLSDEKVRKIADKRYAELFPAYVSLHETYFGVMSKATCMGATIDCFENLPHVLMNNKNTMKELSEQAAQGLAEWRPIVKEYLDAMGASSVASEGLGPESFSDASPAAKRGFVRSGALALEKLTGSPSGDADAVKAKIAQFDEAARSRSGEADEGLHRQRLAAALLKQVETGGGSLGSDPAVVKEVVVQAVLAGIEAKTKDNGYLMMVDWVTSPETLNGLRNDVVKAISTRAAEEGKPVPQLDDQKFMAEVTARGVAMLVGYEDLSLEKAKETYGKDIADAAARHLAA